MYPQCPSANKKLEDPTKDLAPLVQKRLKIQQMENFLKDYQTKYPEDIIFSQIRQMKKDIRKESYLEDYSRNVDDDSIMDIQLDDLILIPDHPTPKKGGKFTSPKQQNQQIFYKYFKPSLKICDDLDKVFLAMEKQMDFIINQFKTQSRNQLKIWTWLDLDYYKSNTEESVPGYINWTSENIIATQEMEPVYNKMRSYLTERNANYTNLGSGFSLNAVTKVTFKYAIFNRLERSGQRHIPLPAFLEKKKSIINVRNIDNRCFCYAIFASMYHDEILRNHRTNPNSYNKYFIQHQINNDNFPVAITDVDKFRQIAEQLQINLFIFGYNDEDGKSRRVYYASETNYEKTVDLLYFSNGLEDDPNTEYHFATITNLEGFMRDQTKHNNRRFYCRRCLQGFRLESALLNHARICGTQPINSMVYRFPAKNSDESFLQFKHAKYQQRHPFVIYADTEALIPEEDFDLENTANTHVNQIHQAISMCFVLKSPIPELDGLMFLYTGEDVVTKFLLALIEMEKKIKEYLFDDMRMIFTIQDQQDFDSSIECYMCKKPFTNGNFKVRDHDHFTGNFRGAACNLCNMKNRKQYKIIVVFHNFRGYDEHFLIDKLNLTEADIQQSQFPATANGPFVQIDQNNNTKRELNVIGQGMEKYLSIDWGMIRFIDSYQHCGQPLATLVENLKKKDENKFEMTRKIFANPNIHFSSLLRKGVFPYDYFNNIGILEERELPPKEAFFSQLYQDGISEEDYAHAQNMWQQFGCQTFKDYMELYLKTDVTTLCDIFENFRDFCLQDGNYELDPVYYVSAPSLSLDASLLLLYQRIANFKIDLMSDSAMYRALIDGMRGRIIILLKTYLKINV
jgi:hypothetical protein